MRNEKHRDQPGQRLWPQAENNNAPEELLLNREQIKNAPGFDTFAIMV